MDCAGHIGHRLFVLSGKNHFLVRGQHCPPFFHQSIVFLLVLAGVTDCPTVLHKLSESGYLLKASAEPYHTTVSSSIVLGPFLG